MCKQLYYSVYMDHILLVVELKDLERTSKIDLRSEILKTYTNVSVLKWTHSNCGN